MSHFPLYLRSLRMKQRELIYPQIQRTSPKPDLGSRSANGGQSYQDNQAPFTETEIEKIDVQELPSNELTHHSATREQVRLVLWADLFGSTSKSLDELLVS